MDTTQHILVVDDDESTRRILSLIFAEKGYQTTVAASGQDAIQQAQQSHFNLALLDVRLPDVDGVELIAPLKELNPDIMLIIATAYASVDTAMRALNEGAAAYITKPLKMEEVLAVVDDALEKQRLLAENRRLFQAAQRELAERERVENTLQQRNLELATLNRTGQILASTLDLDQVLATVLEETRHLLDAIACSVWLTDPETGELVCRQATDPHSEIVRGWRMAPGDGLVGWVALHGQSMNVPDAQTDSRHFSGLDQRTGLSTRSVLGAPLVVKQNTIGVLQVLAKEVGRFSDTDLDLVESLAAFAAAAIQNSRLFEQAQHEILERKRAEDEVQRRNQELAALNAIAAALSQSLDLEEILDAALERTLAALEVAGGLLYLFHKTDQSLVPLTHRGLAKHEIEEINQFSQQTGCFGLQDQTREPLVIPDLSQEATESILATVQAGWRSMVCLPLHAKSGIVGMMLILSHTPARFSHENLSLLRAVSNQIGVVVENVQLAQEAAEVEILRELDRLRSELIANVSHELRTPLGLIKVFCTTLLRDDMDLDEETHREFLHDIDEETDKLEEIVDNLLDLSKMGDGRLRLDKQPTDLGQLARKVIDNLDVQLTQHQFEHDFPPTPLMATVDAKRIEQVLRNLVSNAIKYSPHGGKITVQGRGDKTQVLLWVSDQGIGIPTSELKRVFERFYRVESHGTEEVGGVGLGLAVCQGIVEAHHGQIWAESALGVGSTFYVALPTSPKLELSQPDFGSS